MAVKVLVLGARGGIAQHVTRFLKGNKGVELTLFSRNTSVLKDEAPGAAVIEGDVLRNTDLDTAIKGQYIVYANLAGQIDKMAAAIVKSMEAAGVKRLIFITSLGIYKEIPGKFGQWNEIRIRSLPIATKKALRN
ncbi:NAD(P)H-binding protein [Dyadobacter jiangsuensis]|uniref:Putative NAD(P)-binding protein n=1 Tax=Dyadobacter jiangsuensis TaxID=1591085 RepID=A0A2P8FLD8_9BACT|nr:NAD(P)H-binding protein [Dyadobacter jiangsuensis]PSL22530.1 putative NAD(P)-binding protein [Dyadobacter jiangsuensis]